MEKIRKPFQGVLNIIRFNWDFYIGSIIMIILLILSIDYVGESGQNTIYTMIVLASLALLNSLLVSFYVYDLSGLYNLNWITETNSEKLIVNINAGFDETSALLKRKFRNAELIVLDFYDPTKHTEVSIKRARKAYPSYPSTKQITTTSLPLVDSSVDKLLITFSAHEIRNDIERSMFFKELQRVIKPDGQIYLTEHLRDTANFLAYSIGFFHFLSRSTWLQNMREANLQIKEELKLTPFVSTFIIIKNGNTL